MGSGIAACLRRLSSTERRFPVEANAYVRTVFTGVRARRGGGVTVAPRCPDCSKWMVRSDLSGGPLRFVCVSCNGRFWVPTWQVALLTFAPLLLLIPLHWFYPDAGEVIEQVVPKGFAGFLGELTVVSLVALGRMVLVPCFASLHRSGSPTVRLTRGEVGFLLALQVEQEMRAGLLLSLVCLSCGVPIAIEAWHEGRLAASALLVLVPLALFPILASKRCPSCRQRLLMQSPRQLWALPSVRACPFCGFAPSVASDIVEASTPTAVGRFVNAAVLVAAVVVGFLPWSRTIPTLPPPEAPALYEADLDWRYQDSQGGWHEGSDLRGKPLVLNLTTTTCNRCWRRLSSIAALSQAVGNDAVVLSVSNEPLATLRTWSAARDGRPTFHHVERETWDRLGGGDRPRVLIIDATGRVRVEDTRASAWHDLDVQAYLRSLGAVEPVVGIK